MCHPVFFKSKCHLGRPLVRATFTQNMVNATTAVYLTEILDKLPYYSFYLSPMTCARNRKMVVRKRRYQLKEFLSSKLTKVHDFDPCKNTFRSIQ